MLTNALGRPAPTVGNARSALFSFGRVVALSALLATLDGAALAGINRDAYEPSNVDDVTAIYRSQVHPQVLENAETNLVKPESRYRLRLRATGRMRNISPDGQAVIRALTFRHPSLSQFLAEYTHEVEVAYSGRSIWLYLQQGLVVPFRAERRGGGLIDVYAVLAGGRGSELLLLATAFESIAEESTEGK